MKKIIIWLVVFALLFVSGCQQNTNDDDEKEVSMRCIACRKVFSEEEINADFGLCRACMLEAGATSCTQCTAPSYVKDMVEGMCKDCSASSETANGILLNTKCTYCSNSIPAEYTVGNCCIGCYSIRQGVCLKCLQQPRYADGSHCQTCKNSWSACASCGKMTAGSEMFRDICQGCYLQKIGSLVICPLCGKSVFPSDVCDGFCSGCSAMADYDKKDEAEQKPTYKCSTCGRGFSNADNLYEGKCWSCYNSSKNLCIVCKKNPSQGYGPSGMECYDCYSPQDEALGVFVAPYENVKIIIEKHDLVDYTLTYIDQNTEQVISRIPLSYYSSNSANEKWLFFDLSEYDIYGPTAYVEFCISIGARASFSYNSLIIGMADTGGYYSPLDREN